jgi:hypothetical protein
MLFRHTPITSTDSLLEFPKDPFVSSLNGRICFKRSYNLHEKLLGWNVASSPAELGKMHIFPKPGFSFDGFSETRVLVIPHWLMLVVFGGFASLPWLHWQFSLRTLLIAMTVVAALLGLLVWAMNRP